MVTEAQNGDSVNLSEGQQLVIRLSAQLGTGYSWSLVSSESTPLRLLNERTEPRSVAEPGGQETQLFTFSAAAAGSTELKLAYRRPWLPHDAAARGFSLRVTVH